MQGHHPCYIPIDCRRDRRYPHRGNMLQLILVDVFLESIPTQTIRTTSSTRHIQQRQQRASKQRLGGDGIVSFEQQVMMSMVVLLLLVTLI